MGVEAGRVLFVDEILCQSEHGHRATFLLPVREIMSQTITRVFNTLPPTPVKHSYTKAGHLGSALVIFVMRGNMSYFCRLESFKTRLLRISEGRYA